MRVSVSITPATQMFTTLFARYHPDQADLVAVILNPRVARLLPLACTIFASKSSTSSVLLHSLLMPSSLVTFIRTCAHPFDNSGFAEREITYCWYYATNGLLGWVIKLLRYAARKAVQYHEATVSRSLLADAYQICIAEPSIGRRKVNPFAVPHFSEPEGNNLPMHQIERSITGSIARRRRL